MILLLARIIMFLSVFLLHFQVVYCFLVFFFKQKTAYEMRISDWSSDVCSSDLAFHEFILNLLLRPRILPHTLNLWCVSFHDTNIYGQPRGWGHRSEERRVGKE